MTNFGVAPRVWPDATVVCLGTGPSLTPADVDWCRGRGRVIAINDAYRLAPWADCLYAADGKWWRWHKDQPAIANFAGLKYSIEPANAAKAGAVLLKNRGHDGLCLDPAGLCTGGHSGYQAINLAVHFGATRILLLGYDMRGAHFFGKHPDNTGPNVARAATYATLVAPLRAAGVTVLNCTERSAIGCFPRAPLREVLPATIAPLEVAS